MSCYECKYYEEKKCANPRRYGDPIKDVTEHCYFFEPIKVRDRKRQERTRRNNGPRLHYVREHKVQSAGTYRRDRAV